MSTSKSASSIVVGGTVGGAAAGGGAAALTVADGSTAVGFDCSCTTEGTTGAEPTAAEEVEGAGASLKSSN